VGRANRLSKGGLALLAMMSVAAVAACSSGEASRSAAEGGRAVGAHVCVSNESKGSITVDFTQADKKPAGTTLASGATACAEGMTTPDKWDVAGYINKNGPDQLMFGVDNPVITSPFLEIIDADQTSSNYGLGVCSDSSGWPVGVTRTLAVPALQVEAHRNPDDAWTQFVFVVRDGDGSTQGTTDCDQR
jgi:hypothetical protein